MFLSHYFFFFYFFREVLLKPVYYLVRICSNDILTVKFHPTHIDSSFEYASPIDDFRKLLVRRELMTSYQVDKLSRGETKGYFYGEYKVLYLVGTGTFARVYRAVHRETGEVVAVKVLRLRFSQDPEQTEQFLREGEMGAKLRHENIVPCYNGRSPVR